MNGSQSAFSRASLSQVQQSPILFSLAVALLVSMHIAGLVGLNWSVSQPLFTVLIPFNLLATSGIVLFFHSGFNWKFFIFCVITFLVGFGIEVLGVKTGLIFGHYRYGPVLGWALWQVPLLIGFNWFTLIYCTGIIAENWLKVNWLKPILAALLMVMIDVWIEPVAVHLNFWTWQNNSVPFLNYIGWFVVSLVLQVVFRYLVTIKRNPIASATYFTQFAFFLAFNILLWLLR